MSTLHAGTNADTYSIQRPLAKTAQVHKFLIPNVGFRENLAFNFYATKEAIGRFRGTAIVGTAVEVDATAIDEYGVYYPPLHAPRAHF